MRRALPWLTLAIAVAALAISVVVLVRGTDAIRGQRGPAGVAGRQGPPGADGQDGEQGPSGVTDLSQYNACLSDALRSWERGFGLETSAASGLVLQVPTIGPVIYCQP
jgi:hypothetical protein